jgi:predicted dehydrogenase
VRWGILGTGWIAGQFVADLHTAGCAVTAVGSRRQDSADAFAAEHRISRAYPSYESLVADPDVDIVYVATPHPFHARDARLALEAGKHVLVEKAFTLNARQAADLVALAKRHDRFLLEAMWTRFLPHMMRIREIVAAGTIGDVRTVLADHNQDLPKDPAHRLNNPHLGGGALLDLGVYPVSFAHDLLGPPTEVRAIAAMTTTGVDRQVGVLLGHDDGRQAVLHAALDTAGPNRAAVLGTRGRIEIDAPWYQATSFTVYDPAGAIIERFDHPIPGRGMQFQALAAEHCITAGRPGSEVLPPAETVAIMRTLDAVRAQIGLRYPEE